MLRLYFPEECQLLLSDPRSPPGEAPLGELQIWYDRPLRKIQDTAYELSVLYFHSCDIRFSKIDTLESVGQPRDAKNMVDVK